MGSKCNAEQDEQLKICIVIPVLLIRCSIIMSPQTKIKTCDIIRESMLSHSANIWNTVTIILKICFNIKRNTDQALTCMLTKNVYVI